MKNKLLGISEAILLALVIVAGAIALPLLCRPFYYAHIEPYDLPAQVGLSAQQVKTAYDQVMDFCIGLTDEFSAGELAFSQEGADHFADVRKLFILDLWVFAVGTALLIAVKWFTRKSSLRLAGHTPGFWAAIGLGVSFATVGILAAIDFDRAFEVFHRVCFPGKENWLFLPEEDPVILMLPWEFFRNCAILIFAGILLCCGGMLLYDRRKK